jgi:hypothetical protein
MRNRFANIEKFPAAMQARMDLLLDKNSEGTITSEQKREVAALVKEAEELMVKNATRLLVTKYQSRLQ